MNYIQKVKICCIQNLNEARMAAEAGAFAIGLVSEMPSGPGVIPEDLIAFIAHAVPAKLNTFLLTSKQDANSIIRQHKKCLTTAIQLVDSISESELVHLKSALPDIDLVQVIHVRDESAIEEAKKFENFFQYILLDSGNPDLDVKELGGTGRTHNWAISREIVKQVSKPVFLAGGLNPLNVREAISFVQPFGVDVCSGVRTNGRLDPGKLAAFFVRI